MTVSINIEKNMFVFNAKLILEVNREDLQTLVATDDLLTNNVHNNVSDNLLLIENGEITAMNDNKKSNIFT